MCRLACSSPGTLQVAANPPLLKPGDVAQLPHRWIDHRHLRNDKIGRFQRQLVLAK